MLAGWLVTGKGDCVMHPDVITCCWYVALGLLCGVCSAALGVGGGFLLVPAFTLAFAFGQKDAQGTSLAILVPITLVGAVMYKANPNLKMDLTVIAIVSAAGVAGAVIGALIATRLPDHVLRRGLAVLMIVVAIKMMIQRPDGKELGHNEAQPGPAQRAATARETGPH